MTHDDEARYLHRRAEQERLCADRASDGIAAGIHRRLADHYSERAARIVLPPLRTR